MLQEVLIEAGYDPFSYSGRGMFGKNCLAVRISNIGDFIADIFDGLYEGVDLDKIGKSFRSMKTDSLGYDTVVYFPNIAYEDSLEDES